MLCCEEGICAGCTLLTRAEFAQRGWAVFHLCAVLCAGLGSDWERNVTVLVPSLAHAVATAAAAWSPKGQARALSVFRLRQGACLVGCTLEQLPQTGSTRIRAPCAPGGCQLPKP